MKITLFTSDNLRHNYFINLLSTVSKKLYVVQEKRDTDIEFTNIKKNYFKKVNISQSRIFKKNSNRILNNNIEILPTKSGYLNKISSKILSDFLRSDIYILFGCSYVRGELLDFLVKKKAISFHMGLSPYYIGSDCNFWALYDNNPHLVGATAHYISKKNDSGSILYHAMSKNSSNIFDYSMSVSKSCMYSIVSKIKNKSLFNLKVSMQKGADQIRNTNKNDFNDEVISDFLKRKINLKNINFKYNLLTNPYFLNSDEI